MKKILRRCFGIFLFTTIIMSMLNLVGTPVGDITFPVFGVVCIAVCGLSILALWCACIAVLISVVIQVIKAGDGLSTMFQKLVDTVTKTKDKD